MATSNTVISPLQVAQDVAQKRQQDDILREQIMRSVWGDANYGSGSPLQAIVDRNKEDSRAEAEKKLAPSSDNSSLENLASSMTDGVRSRIAEEYGFDKNVDPYEIMQYLMLKGEMKKAGLQTEEERNQQKMAAGANLGALLGKMLPGTEETVTAPARGFGVVSRK